MKRTTSRPSATATAICLSTITLIACLPASAQVSAAGSIQGFTCHSEQGSGTTAVASAGPGLQIGSTGQAIRTRADKIISLSGDCGVIVYNIPANTILKAQSLDDVLITIHYTRATTHESTTFQLCFLVSGELASKRGFFERTFITKNIPAGEGVVAHRVATLTRRRLNQFLYGQDTEKPGSPPLEFKQLALYLIFPDTLTVGEIEFSVDDGAGGTKIISPQEIVLTDFGCEATKDCEDQFGGGQGGGGGGGGGDSGLKSKIKAKAAQREAALRAKADALKDKFRNGR